MDRRRLIAVVIVIFSALVAVSAAYIYYNAPELSGEEKIGVIVTLPPQSEFVEKVGVDRVQVSVMVPPGASPHVYEPTPAQMKEVSKAKVYFKVGSGVEFERVWLDKIAGVNPAMLVVNTSEGITLLDNDPHIWNSPRNAKSMVENICTGLIQVDPDNADFYIKNKENYQKELDILDGYIQHKLGGFTNRAFMIYHPAFGYFAHDYNLTQLAVEHGGKEPTSRVIQDCIENAREYNLQYVFVAPQFATKQCETIAKEIGGETAPMDPLARDYIINMRAVAGSLALEFETQS